MIVKILTLPDERLRQRSQEVKVFDKSLLNLIENLTDTLLDQKDPPGLGISAPQIGVFKRVFVGRIRGKPKAFVNPKILKFSKKMVTYLEGCLSIPELFGHVVRPQELDIEWQDRQGKKSKGHLKGIAARIAQHEVDHLNGILFVDHIHTQKGKVFKVEKDKEGKDEFIEVTLA